MNILKSSLLELLFHPKYLTTIRRHSISINLAFVALCAFLLGVIFVIIGSLNHLTELNLSLEIIVFSLTAAGLLAIYKYLHLVAAELDHKNWKKLEHLESRYQNFRDRHLTIIQAFDYPHILREKYLHLCDKTLSYDNATPENQHLVFTQIELAYIRELDDFLDFFENLYFSLDNKLINANDLLIFLGYYIIILGNTYFNPEYQSLKNYIDRYYYNIPHLLEIIQEQIRVLPVRAIKHNRKHFPKAT